MKYIKFKTNKQFKEFQTFSGFKITEFILVPVEYFCNLPSKQGVIISFDLFIDLQAYESGLQPILIFGISNAQTKRNEAIQLQEFTFLNDYDAVFSKLVENFNLAGFNVEIG